jgi:hypothetical protein
MGNSHLPIMLDPGEHLSKVCMKVPDNHRR